MKLYAEALQIIKDEISTLQLQTEVVRIEESLNRILAEDIISDVDLPPFDNSAMDGYAVKFSARKSWRVIGEVTAGNFHQLSLSQDEAVLITTGSKIPIGADTVIPVEDVLLETNFIQLKDNASFNIGMNIRLNGNDLSKNEIALNKFTKIDSKAVSVLASCDKEFLTVFKHQKIAILSTGDELIPINQIPSDDKLRVSNSYSLNFAVREMNHIPVDYGFVKDAWTIIANKIQQMVLDDNDIIITTGGVSVGKYDFVKEIYAEMGIEIKFWKANIKPGKPIVFGTCLKDKRKKLIFGLPGNPVSSLVNFHIFIKPAINNLFHQTDIDYFLAELDNDIMKNDSKRHFSRGMMFYEHEKPKVKSLSSQSSGNLVEMSRANCLIEIPEEVLNPKKGDLVKCIRI
jgi:molybdopterin molybdotransferase